MAKKVDFFAADKNMSKRVAEFMRVKVWNVTLKTRLKKEIADLEHQLEIADELYGSALDRIDEETGENFIEVFKARKIEASEQKQKELTEALKEEGTFAYTDIDKAFYKAYKNDGSKSAIIGWFKTYGLDVEGTNVLKDLEDTIAGKKRSTARTIVRSNATQFVDDKRTKTDVLGLFYGRLSEMMLEAGTLKAESIPADVREFYAPKKKNNK